MDICLSASRSVGRSVRVRVRVQKAEWVVAVVRTTTTTTCNCPIPTPGMGVGTVVRGCVAFLFRGWPSPAAGQWNMREHMRVWLISRPMRVPLRAEKWSIRIC